VRRRFRHRRRQVYGASSVGGLELTALGDVRILSKLGEGVSCIVYLAEWRGREVALKLYKAGAIERHHRLVGGELARYEYERNLAFHRAPGLARYVAEPISYLCGPGIAACVQERLIGPLYYQYHRDAGGRSDEALFAHVRQIVALSHAAGLYDVDLHAGNFVVVREQSGELVPKLFDFNFIPFYVHAPNPAVWLGLRLGLIDRRWRDLRKLERFHDFRRLERKIRLFGEPKNAASAALEVGHDGR
jgi:hypothetical protein